MLPEVSDFSAAIPLNDRALEGAQDLRPTPRPPRTSTRSGAASSRKRCADFRESGADLPPDQKATRGRRSRPELSKLTKKFSENVLDSTNAWELVIDDEASLAGLPESAMAAARADAAAPRASAPRTTRRGASRCSFPSMFPVLQHPDDDGLRREVWEGSCTVGSGGEHDNTALVWEILELRQEKAALLGFANFADLILQRRMAKDGATALEFVEDLHARIVDAFQPRVPRARRTTRRRRPATPAAPLEPWEARLLGRAAPQGTLRLR